MLHLLRLTLVFVVISLSVPGYSEAEEPQILPAVKDTPAVNIERVEKDVKKILQGKKPVLPSRQMKEEGEKKAAKAMADFNSSGNRRKRQEEQKRMEKELSRIQKKSSCSAKVPASIAEVPPDRMLPEFSGKEKVYVFLSSSMPDQAVNAYIGQAALSGGGRVIPVFYGFPGGLAHKRAAGRYFAHMMLENMDCKDAPGRLCPRYKVRIKVNPGLFAKFDISRVPSVVYTNGDDSWAAAGDATFTFLLGRINGDAKSPFLAQVIKKSRGAYGKQTTGRN